MYADSYSFRTIWNADDNEFVGYCAEFPELSAFALDEPSAMRGIEGLVANAITNMEANGEKIPRPFPKQWDKNNIPGGKPTPEEKLHEALEAGKNSSTEDTAYPVFDV